MAIVLEFKACDMVTVKNLNATEFRTVNIVDTAGNAIPLILAPQDQISLVMTYDGRIEVDDTVAQDIDASKVTLQGCQVA